MFATRRTVRCRSCYPFACINGTACTAYTVEVRVTTFACASTTFRVSATSWKKRAAQRPLERAPELIVRDRPQVSDDRVVPRARSALPARFATYQGAF